MDTNTTIIRPGILVSLKSTVHGGVQYQRVNLTPDEVKDSAVGIQKWETTKIVDDPDEHARATKVRSQALGRIRKVCVATSFGLLCPLADEAALYEAIRQARAEASAFNAEASFTRVQIYALAGKVASTDDEAVRAIGSEVSALVRQMNEAIDRMDVEGIRDAATRARETGTMLSDDQKTTLSLAVEQARKAARQITARVEKKGEDAAIVIKDIQRGALEKARIAFLDFDSAPSEAVAVPTANVERVAGLDLNVDGEG